MTETKSKYKFKGKAYDKWVEGDLFHDYEYTYIRTYFNEVNQKGETFKSWADWVVDPKTISIVPPRLTNKTKLLFFLATILLLVFWFVATDTKMRLQDKIKAQENTIEILRAKLSNENSRK